MTRREWYRNVYLRSRYWKWVRRKIARRAGYACEARGCRRIGMTLDVHHMTYKILFFEWLFPWKLIYLCREHHDMVHAGKRVKLKRWWIKAKTPGG